MVQKFSEAMQIKPEDLTKAGYFLYEKLEHDELIPFVRKSLHKWSLISIFFYGVNLGLLVLVVVYAWIAITKHDIAIGDLIFYYSFGFTVCLILIPIHEFIHVMAYKWLGAKETSLDYNLKKFSFMALANNFVANRKEFTMVALMPFTLISCFLILLLFFVDHYWQLTILSTLLLHSAMCSGDFGIVNFFHIHKSKHMVTYDDTLNKVSFFFIKKTRTNE